MRNTPDTQPDTRFLIIAARVIGALILFNAIVWTLHLALIITALIKGIPLAGDEACWPLLVARLGLAQIGLLLSDYLLFTYKPEN